MSSDCFTKTSQFNNDAVSRQPSRELKPKESRCSRTSWKKSWIDFTESTTLHGIRFIWSKGTFRLRRLVWLVIILCGIGIMLYQIVDRIVYYSQMPVSVNVEVNFNETLAFPAVTICNQNTFRATAAASDGRYRLIESMYSSQSNFSLEKLSTEYNASDITLDNLYLRAAHKKEDLVVSCRWGHTPCTAANFTQKITDHGVCFTFDTTPSGSMNLEVANPGIEHGLKLVLNVEQYEYMPGPHGAAGAKIFIHDKDEFPMVGDLGLAVPTGSHTFIGNSLFVLKNLPPPHGQCGSRPLEYFPDDGTYTSTTCKIDCFTREMNKECGCRDAYLPNITGNSPVCTLEQYFTCAHPFKRIFTAKEKDLCNCPVPCDFMSYEPSISYATTSSFVIDKILADLNSAELQDKYEHARETTHRLERSKFESFQKLSNNVVKRLHIIELLFEEHIKLKLSEQKEILHVKKQEILKVWKRKDHINRYQKYVIEKNFLRARDAMEERTLGQIGDGFQSFALDVEIKLRDLVNASDQSTRDMLYLLLTNEINVELVMIRRGRDNLTQLIDAYKNGKGIFNYQFSRMSRRNNPYIVPKKLLNDSLYRTWNAVNYGLRITDQLDTLMLHIQGYRHLIDSAYYEKTVNQTEFESVQANFLRYNRLYFHNRANLYFESLEWPVEVMNERIDHFKNLWNQFSSLTDDIESNIMLINNSLTQIQSTIMPRFRELGDLSQEYIINATVKKLEVAGAVLSPEIHEGINTLKVFFLEVRSRGQNIFDDWTKLVDTSSDIWRAILNDEDTWEYYKWRGYHNFLRNESTVLGNIAQTYETMRDDNDIRDLIDNSDRFFYSSLYDMMSAMGDFKRNTKLDSGFLRENFVFLDIFYSQLSYEQVTQQEEYGIFPLLCDIGGSMGLFLGASVLSLFELVDLIINQSFERVLNMGQSRR